MARSFMHNPLMSKSSTTMITACFSHKSLLHFGFNSLALYSIGSAASEWMSRPNRAREESLEILRSTSRYEFLSFFIACGLFASLISHIYSIKFKLPRINRQVSLIISESR